MQALEGKEALLGNATTAVQAVQGSRPFPGLWPAMRSLAITAALLIAVLYGSLIPFRFSRDRLTPEFLNENLLRFHSTSFEDVVVNVFLYTGVAACMTLLSRRRDALSGFLTVSACALLSVVAESLQTLLPQRVSSATDVLLNIGGAALGVLLVRPLLVAQKGVTLNFARWFRLQPLSTLAIVLSAGLIAWQLIPFDFITSTDQLHEAFRRLKPGERFQFAMADIVSELPFAAWFALLGFVVARDGLSRGKLPIHALRSGLAHSFVLSLLIESLQLFTQSHVSEALPIVVRSVSALLGAWTAVFLISETTPGRSNDSVFRISMPMLMLASAVQFLVLGIGLAPQRIELGDSASSLFRLPFQALWLAPLPLAGAKALSAIVTSGLLAATLAAAMRRAHIPYFRVATTMVVIGFHLVFQLLALTGKSQAMDLTNTVLALLACSFALRVERWTSRLDSYAKLPAGR